MEHFVIIRFSVQFNNRPEFNKRLLQLFNEDRLKLRIKLFKEFCLWSLVNQTLINYKVIIIYDKYLPKKYLQELIELTQPYKFIILHPWNINHNIETNEWLQPYIDKSKELLITSRFDDDDITKININELLYSYIKRKRKYIKNCIISFAKGKFIYINKDSYERSPCCYTTSIGIWLTHITDINSNINIYNFDHSRINSIKLYNLDFGYMWGCVNHNWGNDNRVIRMRNKYKSKISKINLNDIYTFFKDII